MGILTPSMEKKIKEKEEAEIKKKSPFRADAGWRPGTDGGGLRNKGLNMKRENRTDIYTIVLHHPARPVSCLIRTLQSLRFATNGTDHIVDVIVQGKIDWDRGYPRRLDGCCLKYSEVGKNLGIGGGFKHGVERFLRTKYKYIAKIDDDIEVPPRGWDVLVGIVDHEKLENKQRVGSVMMSTEKTRTRVFSMGLSPNNVKTMKPIDGHHGYSAKKIYGRNVLWAKADFADIGCTVYNRDLFESGCIPDERLFVGGIGLDLVCQGNEHGFSWFVCRSPRCNHFGCNNKRYKKIRYDKDVFVKSHKVIYKKWGFSPVKLAELAGLVMKNGKVII